MKTKLMLLVTAVITLGSLSSCVVPYGYASTGYYRPWYGYGVYNNYHARPDYAYSGYRAPYYGRPGFTGYRSGWGGYHGGYTHVGGFHGGHMGGFHHR